MKFYLKKRFIILGTAIMFTFFCCFFVTKCKKWDAEPKVSSIQRAYFSIGKEPVEFRKVKTLNLSEIRAFSNRHMPFSISREQALEDAETFRYLIVNSYSGREYAESKWIDFENIFLRIKRVINTYSNSIKTSDLEYIFYSELSSIFDGHLKIKGKNRYTFHEHLDAYFSDILVEKKENKYVVIDSACPKVKKGDIFTESKSVRFLYPTLSPPEQKHYIVGALSYDLITKAKLSFNDKKFEIPLHITKIRKAQYKHKFIFLS